MPDCTSYIPPAVQGVPRVAFFTPSLTRRSFFTLVMLMSSGIPLCFGIIISLMTNDVDYLFMRLLAIYISSMEKCLFQFIALFLIGLYIFLLISCKSFYKFWTLYSNQIFDSQIFSPILQVVFFFVVSFDGQEFFILAKLTLSLFPFVGICIFWSPV